MIRITFIGIMVALLVLDMIGRCRMKTATTDNVWALAINGALIVMGVLAIFERP